MQADQAAECAMNEYAFMRWGRQNKMASAFVRRHNPA
jgi:hypothetical protein